MSSADHTGPADRPPPAVPVVDDGGDWPAQAAGSIVDLVDQVRDRTTGRAVVAARGVVFGTLIAVVALVGSISLVIALVRGTQVFLEHIVGVSTQTAVWASYLLVGALFVVVGGVLWRVANRKATERADQATADS